MTPFQKLSTRNCLGQGALCVNPCAAGDGAAGWIVSLSRTDKASSGRRNFVILGAGRQRWEAFEDDLVPLAPDDARLPGSPPPAWLLWLTHLSQSRWVYRLSHVGLLASVLLLYAGAVPDERDVAENLKLIPTRDLVILGCETTGDLWNVRVCTVTYRHHVLPNPRLLPDGTWERHREYHVWRRISPFEWKFEGAVPAQTSGGTDV